MALNVIVTVEIKNQAYEGPVLEGTALKETGFVNASLADFASTPKELIENMVESAIENARNRVHDKLNILKGGSPPKKD